MRQQVGASTCAKEEQQPRAARELCGQEGGALTFGENYGDGTLLKQLKLAAEWLDDAYDDGERDDAMEHAKNLMEGAFVMWRRLMDEGSESK